MPQKLTCTIKSDENGKYTYGWGIKALTFTTSVSYKAPLRRDKVQIRNKYAVLQTIRLNEPILTAGHENMLFTLFLLGFDKCKEEKCTAENYLFITFLWIWCYKVIISYNRGQLDDNIHASWCKVRLLDITGDAPTLTLLFTTKINWESWNIRTFLDAFSGPKIWFYL